MAQRLPTLRRSSASRYPRGGRSRAVSRAVSAPPIRHRVPAPTRAGARSWTGGPCSLRCGRTPVSRTGRRNIRNETGTEYRQAGTDSVPPGQETFRKRDGRGCTMTQEMRFVAIGVEPGSAYPVPLLQEISAGHRLLAVRIGLPEASAIEHERRHLESPRPTTHQLIGEVISSSKKHLDRICVTAIDDGAFCAELVIEADLRISARVSDAVALALHLGVPMYAADDVLEQAALSDVEVIDIVFGDSGDSGGSFAEEPVNEDAELESMR